MWLQLVILSSPNFSFLVSLSFHISSLLSLCLLLCPFFPPLYFSCVLSLTSPLYPPFPSVPVIYLSCSFSVFPFLMSPLLFTCFLLFFPNFLNSFLSAFLFVLSPLHASPSSCVLHILFLCHSLLFCQFCCNVMWCDVSLIMAST